MAKYEVELAFHITRTYGIEATNEVHAEALALDKAQKEWQKIWDVVLYVPNVTKIT